MTAIRDILSQNITRLLATRRPADPTWFDYALFGIGVGGGAMKPDADGLVL